MNIVINLVQIIKYVDGTHISVFVQHHNYWFNIILIIIINLNLYFCYYMVYIALFDHFNHLFSLVWIT